MSLDPHALDALLDDLAERVAARLAEQASADVARTHEAGTGPNGWRLLSVAELADRLGRSERWVHDACRTRALPFVRLDRGGGKAFDLEDVQAWARARRVPADGS